MLWQTPFPVAWILTHCLLPNVSMSLSSLPQNVLLPGAGRLLAVLGFEVWRKWRVVGYNDWWCFLWVSVKVDWVTWEFSWWWVLVVHFCGRRLTKVGRLS